MREVGALCIVVFDVFEKSSIDKIKSKLANFNLKQSPLDVTIGHDVPAIRETRDLWEIPDLNNLISQISEFALSSRLTSDVSLFRNSISDAFFLGLESEELPFYVLAFVVKFDASKFNGENILRHITNVIHPLRIYMDSFEGLTPNMFSFRPCVPYVAYLTAKVTEEELKSLLDTSDSLLQLGDAFDNVSVDKKKELCSRFQSIDILSNRHEKWNLLSCVTRYASLLCICGHLDQLALGGLLTPFVITLTNDEQHLSTMWYIDKHHLPGILPSIYNIYREGGAIASFIFFISNLIWLNYLERKIEKIDISISEVRSRIQDKSLGELDNLDGLVVEWNKIGSSIGRYSGEIGRLIRVLKPKLDSYWLTGRISQPEIPIIPSDGSFYFWLEQTIQLDSDGKYVKTLSSQITKISSGIQKTLEDLSREVDRLNTHLSSLSNIRMQKSMKKYTEQSRNLTIIIAGLTGVLIYLTYAILQLPKP